MIVIGLSAISLQAAVQMAHDDNDDNNDDDDDCDDDDDDDDNECS